jgi:2'-5' RNA ligase
MTRPPSKPPVESIELRFDAAADAALRDLWAAVDRAGARTLARHAYNEPHVTLAALPHTGGALADRRDAVASAVAGLLGTELVFSGAALFPHATSVLYAAVVPTRALLQAHAELHAVLRAAGLQPYPTSLPERWTPHATIAKRVRCDQLGAALTAVAGAPWPIRAQVARVVHWDGADRTTTALAGA